MQIYRPNILTIFQTFLNFNIGMYNQKIEKYVENLFKKKKKIQKTLHVTITATYLPKLRMNFVKFEMYYQKLCQTVSQFTRTKNKSQSLQSPNLPRQNPQDMFPFHDYLFSPSRIEISVVAHFLLWDKKNNLIKFQTRQSFDFLRVYKTCEFKV